MRFCSTWSTSVAPVVTLPLSELLVEDPPSCWLWLLLKLLLMLSVYPLSLCRSPCRGGDDDDDVIGWLCSVGVVGVNGACPPPHSAVRPEFTVRNRGEC